MSNLKTVGGGVLEHRIDFGPGYRIYLGLREAYDGTDTGFPETIRERAQREPRFRKTLVREAIELMLSGAEKTGRAILPHYINATVGFRGLEEATSIPANSLMRMFGPNGNPSAKNLFGVLAHLQAQEGVNSEIRPRRN